MYWFMVEVFMKVTVNGIEPDFTDDVKFAVITGKDAVMALGITIVGDWPLNKPEAVRLILKLPVLKVFVTFTPEREVPSLKFQVKFANRIRSKELALFRYTV